MSSWGAQGTIYLLYVDSLCSRIEISGSVGRRDGPINIMGRIYGIQRLRLTWRIKWVSNAPEICSTLVYGMRWVEVRWADTNTQKTALKVICKNTTSQWILWFMFSHLTLNSHANNLGPFKCQCGHYSKRYKSQCSLQKIIRGQLYSAHSCISLHNSATRIQHSKLVRFNACLQGSNFCGLTWSSVKVLIVCFPEPSAYQIALLCSEWAYVISLS